MQRLQDDRFELKPNGGQQRFMRRLVGSCRFVFNKALALQQDRHKADIAAGAQESGWCEVSSFIK